MIDPDQREDHLLRLRNAGIDVAATQRTRQLEVLAPRDTYLRGGHFDKWAMIELIQEALRAGVHLGFPITRLIAHAEAVLEDSRNARAWVEYESRLNYVLPRFADPVICTYDSRKLDAAVAFDILRTHPVAVVGGLLQLNPFFVPPSELLRELDDRYSAPESRDPGPTQ